MLITGQAHVFSQSTATSEPGHLVSRARSSTHATGSAHTARPYNRAHLKRKGQPDATPRPQHDVQPAGPSRPVDKSKMSACHQCRRTTKHPKMACTNTKPDGDHCTKKYCTICIGKRYPTIAFDASARTFVCPTCLNTCNCSFCTRKRGEVYHGERTGGVHARPAVAKAKDKATPVLPTDPNLDANAKTYWATVYRITGERVATAFVGDDGDDKVIFARPLTHSDRAVCRQGSSVDSIISEPSSRAEDKDSPRSDDDMSPIPTPA